MPPGRPEHRTSRTRRGLVAGIAAALVVTFAACSGGGETDALPSATDQGPLSEYLSAISVKSAAEAEAIDKETNVALQEAIATCMTAKGFEYTPQPHTPGTASAPSEPDNEAWVAQYGFGMAGGFGDMPHTPPPDPNAAYVASLSPTAETAYWEALQGTLPEPDGEDVPWEEMLGQMGCSGQGLLALEETRNADDPHFSPEFADLTSAMTALVDGSLREPTMIDLAARWSSCMADAGYAFTSREEMVEAIMVLRNALPSPHEDGATEAVAAADEQEISTALADLACRDDVEWDARAAQVQHDLEERFIADHKAELDELIAAVEASRGE